MSVPHIHHFFHIYADGEWSVPVREHIEALRFAGLLEELETFQIGIVGSFTNCELVIMELLEQKIRWSLCAQAREGFEQETLDALWKFSQHEDGLVLYAHTKGAANFDPINNSWRRSMLFYNVIRWRTPVAALQSGKSIVGCHWFKGAPAAIPENGTGGMFGGNFWWTRLELVRQNVIPTRRSRWDAEHWIGQLSEIMPITNETILDLNHRPICSQNLRSEWSLSDIEPEE